MSLPLSAIPKPVAVYTTTLAAKILSTDTSLTLETATDDVGNAISGVVGLTCEGEFMIGTKSGTSVTGLLRGIDPQDGTTERTSLKAAHNRGKAIKITNSPFLLIAYRLLNGDEGFPTVLKYASAPSLVSDRQIPDKAYCDALTFAGAPDSNETTKGLVEAATTAEVAAGDDSGSTTAPTVVRPSKLAEVIQAGSYLYGVEDGSGADDTYTWTTTPVTTAYTAGAIRLVKLTVANTGACTGNENGIGAKTFKKYAAGALADLETGDIVANMAALIYYDGTYLVLLNPGASMPTTAILLEMVAFFGATDMTGAEAEALTGGGNTNLHKHYKAAMAATRDLTAATGSVAHAHGLGVAPTWVRVTAFLNSTGGNVGQIAQSIGFWDGTNYDCAYIGGYVSGSWALDSGAVTTELVHLTLGGDATNDNQTATVSVDATNVNLSWTKNNTPTGTAVLLIECGT